MPSTFRQTTDVPSQKPISPCYEQFLHISNPQSTLRWILYCYNILTVGKAGKRKEKKRSSHLPFFPLEQVTYIAPMSNYNAQGKD